MNISALLTSAGINIGVCALLLSLYSILRKQPGNVSVYFGRKLAQEHRSLDSFSLERLVPSPSWIVKAWQTPEEEILASAGLDAVAFIRMLVFSIRIFSIAAVVCIFGVLPLNYYGQYRHRVKIPSESLEVFTIGNVSEGSRCGMNFKYQLKSTGEKALSTPLSMHAMLLQAVECNEAAICISHHHCCHGLSHLFNLFCS